MAPFSCCGIALGRQIAVTQPVCGRPTTLNRRASVPGTNDAHPAANGGYTAANGGYEIYWEEHGKRDGAPALFLHGGPGAGCSRRHAGFFDPDHYRVILHDQRGCGKSGPRGSTIANETPFLIADIEALRAHLGIEKWSCVLGGSWGTTLALEYAQAHPERVSSLVLRAVGRSTRCPLPARLPMLPAPCHATVLFARPPLPLSGPKHRSA